METFDPDQYIAETGPVETGGPAGGFDPDAYLADTGGFGAAIKNIPKDAAGIITNSAKLAARTAKGVSDLPADAIETAGGEWSHLLKGENPLEGIMDSPLGQDARTVGKTAAGMVTGIPKQVKNLGNKEEWIEHPVGNALTVGAIAAPLLKGAGLLGEGAEAARAIPEFPEVPPEVPPAVPGAALPEIFEKPVAPEVPPVMPAAPGPELPTGGGKPVDIYAAPMRGYSGPVAEAHAITQTPEFADWTGKIAQMPGVFGQKSGVGGWVDTETGAPMTEPSSIVYVDPAQADAIAAKIGMGIGGEKGMGAPQQAVMKINRFADAPNGSVHELTFKSPAAFAKWSGQLGKYGINNFSLDPKGNTVILADVGDNLLTSIERFTSDALKEGDLHGTNREVADIQFPGEADYAGILSKAEQNLGPSETGAGQTGGGAARPGTAPPQGPASAPAAAGVTPDALKNLLNQIEIPQRAKALPGKIKDFVNRKLAKPESTPVVSEYMKDFADQMTIKDLGASPMQIRHMDVDPTFPKTHAFAQWARDKGLVDATRGPIGQRKLINSINKESGAALGDLRDEASAAGPAYNMKALLENVANKFGHKYTYGVNKPSMGEFQSALETLARAEPTPAGIADALTQLNKDAQTAHGLNRAHGPYTEVADYVSRINNDTIRQRLGRKAVDYDAALIDFGGSKKAAQFALRKGSSELGGRMGPGSMTRELTQGAMDKIGYRTMSKVASSMADRIRANPAMARSMADMFNEFIHQIETLVDDKEVSHQ